MKISFTIPFYSTPEYLDAAVRSVLAQTESDWELLVVDDRSPHAGIPDQILGYGDSRIRYHLNDQNLGQSGNWNQCLRLAHGELVTILHADDMLHPNYAELMLAAAAQYPTASAMFCGAVIVDGVGEKIFSFADFYKKFLIPTNSGNILLQGESGLRSLIRGNFIMAPTLCYRRSALHSIQFSPRWKCAPDLDFTSRLLMAGGSIVGLPQIAFSYRRHEESGTAVFRRSMQQFEEEIVLYDEISRLSAESGWSAAAKEAKAKKIVMLRLGYFGLKDLVQFRLAAAWGKLCLAYKLMFGSPASSR